MPTITIDLGSYEPCEALLSYDNQEWTNVVINLDKLIRGIQSKSSFFVLPTDNKEQIRKELETEYINKINEYKDKYEQSELKLSKSYEAAVSELKKTINNLEQKNKELCETLSTGINKELELKIHNLSYELNLQKKIFEEKERVSTTSLINNFNAVISELKEQLK